MNRTLEDLMYGASQWFLFPALAVIALLFAHACVALGACLLQARQRRRGEPAGFEALHWHRADPALDPTALEVRALRRLELVRLSSRLAPMLGLVATMIPMGPALQALSEGRTQEMARSLGVAFSAVILALLAAAVAHTVAQVRRRWYASDLAALRQAQETPR